MGAFTFTNLFSYKTDPELGIDPDKQIEMFVKSLTGRLRDGWQVIAPTASSRVIYFEMEAPAYKPELEKGSALELRKAATEEKTLVPEKPKKNKGVK